MQKYPSVIGMLVASVCLWMGTAAAVRLPEGLPNLLKTHNFNIYPAPCQANNMVLRDLTGRVVDLNALRGKVVILNFWKIDCQPCTAEKPILERLHRKYGPRGLEIVAVNLFDDHNRVRAYAKRCGFGFRFCCDPENRFSVQKLTLGGGMPSTFIINSKSDAIYEVPGVPTSYLIDRNGQVIGNGVGMVNWEEQPFTALIESLLGPPTQLAARNRVAFSDVARQGPVAHPTVRQAGPRRMSETPSEPDERQIASRPSQSRGPDALGHQGLDRSEASSDLSTAKKPAPVGKDLRTKRGDAVTRKPQDAKTKPRIKNHRVKNTSSIPVEYGKPKPYRPSIQARGTAGEIKQVSRYLAQAAPGTPLPAPYVPPRTASPTSPPPPGHPVRPALPAAMPYTPPKIATDRRPTSRPVVPDENGQVMARIPPRYTTPTDEEVETAKQTGGASGWPYARPRMPANPIDTFILDSFEPGASPRQAPPQALYPQPDQDRNQVRNRSQPQQQETAPAASILGQLSRDVQNLGEGIRQTFSGWLPGR